MKEYESFLESKSIEFTGIGFTPKVLNKYLFPFQKAIVEWALQKGRSAIFADCGLGKTIMQLAWADAIVKETDGNVLIVTPLSVSYQTVREGHKFHIKDTQSRDGCITGKITVTNYEMVSKFNPDDFVGLVIDECFSPDTLIDCIGLDNNPTKKYIKDVCRNDKIYNAYGVDHVYETHKRRINRAFHISTGQGNFTSSENHPFFTLHGWKRAQDLQTDDYIMETSTAMRLLRKDIYSGNNATKNEKILQSILFSEMENELAGNNSENTHEGNARVNRQKEIRMVQEWIAESSKGIRKDSEPKSFITSRSAEENIIKIASDEMETFRAWGKWSSNDIASAINEGCVVKQLDTGICYITGKMETRFSNVLQSRLRESKEKNSNRNRRIQSWIKERIRQEKRQYAGFVRVDGIEVYEQGNPELERYREADGFIYFYDLKATRHPSYSINGCLVHNSSIIKSFDGKTRNQIITRFDSVKYKLACSATPSPNDYMELGNHSQFLGVMSYTEMLAKFFYHDASNTSQWKLKGHAENDFWKWICSWAVMIRKPSDIGFSDEGFELPELKINQVIIPTNIELNNNKLFSYEARTLEDQRQVKKETVEIRINKCVEMLKGTKETWGIWCSLNSEGDSLAKIIPNAIQVSGSNTLEEKEERLNGFSSGKYPILITKTKIGGFGLNWQHCHNVIFVSMTHSYEAFYQAIRRFWRFGQKHPVNVYLITADVEGPILTNIMRKEKDAIAMQNGMLKYMKIYQDVFKVTGIKDTYKEGTKMGKDWEMKLGDCVEKIKEIKDNSIHYSIFSPPFASLYTYSNSIRDMGNCKDIKQFKAHFRFLIKELLRITMPGRLLSFHCANLQISKGKEGYIGIRDLRGILIQMFLDEGWIEHSEVVIWKDPVVAMQRTKSLTLLHKQIKKDSARCAQGIPDYLITMVKPGENPEKVVHTNDSFPVEVWQNYASPVWMDIKQGNTLQKTSVREEKDEKHICPLQLQVIERGIQLWTNPGDTVFDPFTGIGSTGYVALLQERKFIGIELKEAYYNQAVANLKVANSKKARSLIGISLFDK